MKRTAILLLLLLLPACKAKNPTGPSTPAALTVTTITMTAARAAVGFQYTLNFQIRETSGVTNATVTSVLFTYRVGQAIYAQNQFLDAFNPAVVGAGGTATSRTFNLSDFVTTAQLVTNIDVVVNYTDGINVLSALGTAAVTPPTGPTVTAVTIGSCPTAPLRVGATAQLSATARFSNNSTQSVTTTAFWQSASTSLATVSNAGLVTAVAQGSVDITATFQGPVGRCTVQVVP